MGLQNPEPGSETWKTEETGRTRDLDTLSQAQIRVAARGAIMHSGGSSPGLTKKESQAESTRIYWICESQGSNPAKAETRLWYGSKLPQPYLFETRGLPGHLLQNRHSAIL